MIKKKRLKKEHINTYKKALEITSKNIKVQSAIISVPELAISLKISESTVRRLIYKNKLPAKKKQGTWVLDTALVAHYLYNHINYNIEILL